MKIIQIKNNNGGQAPSPERALSKQERKAFDARLVRGQVMMIVVMALAGVMIGVVAISGSLISKEIHQTADAESFSRAVFAAEAGLEWRLYKSIQDTGCQNCPETGAACGEEPSFSLYSVDLKTGCSENGGKLTVYSKATVKDSSYTLYHTITISQP